MLSTKTRITFHRGQREHPKAIIRTRRDDSPMGIARNLVEAEFKD